MDYCFQPSHFDTALVDIIFGLLSSIIITVLIGLFRKLMGRSKINYINLLLWSLIFSFPIMLTDIIDIFNFGITLIFIFSAAGAILSLLSQVKKNKLHQIFELKSKILYFILVLYLLIIGATFLIERSIYQNPELDTESTDMKKLSNHFLVTKYDLISSSVYDYQQTANIRLIDTVFSKSIEFELDFLYKEDSLFGVDKFLDTYSKITERVKGVDFLWNYANSDKNSLLIVHFSDSLLTQQRITWLLLDYDDYSNYEQGLVRRETFSFFEPAPIDSLEFDLESSEFSKILGDIETVLHLELVSWRGSTNWIITKNNEVYLLKKGSQIFVKSNFNQSYGFEAIDKLIKFDTDGKIIDSTFANSQYK